MGSHEELFRLHPESLHGSLAAMLAFFPNKFDPFDWFIPKLLDALI
jgi:hypothetical protein